MRKLHLTLDTKNSYHEKKLQTKLAKKNIVAILEIKERREQNMAKLRGPLFSLDAKGSVANKLTVRKRRKLHVALEYNKPGDRKPFESSPTQKDQRAIVGLVTIRWNCMTAAEKAPWNAAANASREHISGYNLFIRTAQTDLHKYLGLAGYWSMNYEHQGIIPDLSGNGNNGTLSPDYPSNCPTLDPSINHKFGLAGKFDGVDDYINCGNNESLAIAGNLTIEALIKRNIIGQNLTIVDKNYEHEYFLRVSSNNKLLLYQGDGNYEYFYGANYIGTNWTHTLVTRDVSKKQVIFYVNGEQDGGIQTYSKVVNTSTDNVDIAYRHDSEGNPQRFSGLIDEVRIWNRALGPDEIMRHYKMLRQPNT